MSNIERKKLLEHATLGSTNLVIPSVVFGSMARRDQSDRDRVEIITTAVRHGFSAIDTAPLYGFGQCERQIALALKQMPNEKVQIFTKVGLRWDAGDDGDVLFEHRDAGGRRFAVRKNSRPDSIRCEVEQSLARLCVETLDLVQVHQPDIHTPFADTMGALLDLRTEGKLQNIGVSNFSVKQAQAARLALADVGLASVQPEYSLIRRGIEHELLPWCLHQNTGVLAYSPLAGGMLTGRADREVPLDLSAAIDCELRPTASEHGVCPAVVALAWVNHQVGISAAIAGASSISQVRELAKVAQLQLSTSEVGRLTSAFEAVQQVHSWEQPRGVLGKVRRIVGALIRIGR